MFPTQETSAQSSRHCGEKYGFYQNDFIKHMFHLETSAIIYIICCCSHMQKKTDFQTEWHFCLAKNETEEQMWPP